jgi:hypothetical protein
MGDPSLRAGPLEVAGGGAPSYPSYQTLPLTAARVVAPPIREFVETGEPLLPQELWLSFVGEKGEIPPMNPKGDRGAVSDLRCWAADIRMGRAAVLGIDKDGDSPLSFARKVAIWRTIMACAPSRARMRHPFLAMAVALFVSKGGYVQAIKRRLQHLQMPQLSVRRLALSLCSSAWNIVQGGLSLIILNRRSCS